MWLKVVNNAASVTRLNLSLRLHATIFNAKAALPRPRPASQLLRSRFYFVFFAFRALFVFARESECERVRVTRPTFAAWLLRHCSHGNSAAAAAAAATTKRSSCEENR